MPNQRGKNQKLLNIPADENFIKQVNDGIGAAGYNNRSQFIRDAIIEKLARVGVSIPKSLTLAPPRAGQYPAHISEAMVMAETKKANSKSISGVESLVKKSVAEVEHPPVVFGRRRKAAGPGGKTS